MFRTTGKEQNVHSTGHILEVQLVRREHAFMRNRIIFAYLFSKTVFKFWEGVICVFIGPLV